MGDCLFSGWILSNSEPVIETLDHISEVVVSGDSSSEGTDRGPLSWQVLFESILLVGLVENSNVLVTLPQGNTAELDDTVHVINVEILLGVSHDSDIAGNSSSWDIVEFEVQVGDPLGIVKSWAWADAIEIVL